MIRLSIPLMLLVIKAGLRNPIIEHLQLLFQVTDLVLQVKQDPVVQTLELAIHGF